MKEPSLSPPSRRKFLYWTGSIFTAAILAGLFGFRHRLARYFSKAVPEGKSTVDTESDAAETLGYVEEADQVDVTLFPRRSTPEGKTQFCRNCRYYRRENAEWGYCQILKDGLVKGGGWCNAWAKVAGK